MENNLKKIIILLNDDTKINKIVVVRDTVEMVKASEYGSLVKELFNIYQDELKDLNTNQDKVNRLYRLGLLDATKQDIIVKATSLDDDSKFSYEYASGRYEEIINDGNNDDFSKERNQIIRDIAKMYSFNPNLEIGTVYENLVNLGIIEQVKVKKEEAPNVPGESNETEETENEYDDEDYDDEYEDYDEEKEGILAKVKNLVINHRVLAGIVAGAVLVTGGIAIGRISKKGSDSKSKNIIETTIGPNNTTNEYEQNSNMGASIPSFSINDAEGQAVSVNNQFLSLASSTVFTPEVSFTKLETVPIDEELLVEIESEFLVSRYFNDPEYTFNTEEELLEKLNTVSYTNMSDIADYLLRSDENPLDEKGKIIYFEKLLSNPSDRAFVKYFSDLRNEIVYQMYYEHQVNGVNNISLIDRYITRANTDIVKSIVNNLPLVVEENGTYYEINYNELSREAKRVFLNIAFSIADNFGNKNITIDNNEYDLTEISNIIIDENNQLLNYRTK